VITANNLTGNPAAGRTLPSINDPLAQLGKLLFFSKSLGGDFDTACASCHHPALGGGDGLSLPVGTGAVNPDVVGIGRTRPDGLPNVGRHSQTVFNIALYDAGMFFDSRIESVGKEAGLNGAGSGIRTPDSALNVADLNAGPNLPAAQARFPVTEATEMRGGLMPGASNQAVRNHLAARIGDFGSGQGEIVGKNDWLAEFQTAFVSALPANQLVTFDNIALAIAEYQRSMIFVDTPWKAYVEGDSGAINRTAKEGALLFFRNVAEGGADCAACHSGDFFTDEISHTLAFPQIGPGKGDGASGDDDFGREQQSAAAAERFRFRTPTLLNLGVTAPYSHAGSYDNIDFAVNHYAVPRVIFDQFKAAGGVCSLAQFAQHADCATLYPNMDAQFNAALAKVVDEQTSDPTRTFPDIGHMQQSDFPKIRAFMETLNDPCVSDRACLADWIPDQTDAPDDHQLNATDVNGIPL
jgi:cytochrome c peroxidase